MFNFAKGLFQSVVGVASEDFNEWVKDRTGGREHAHFFEGPFHEAVEASGKAAYKTEGRGLVLLWLHEREDEVTKQLCSDVWPHAGVITELRSRYVGWAGDVFRYEASFIARALRADLHPTLVIIRRVARGTRGSLEWPRGTHFQILWMASGRITGDGLHAQLVEIAETLDSSRRQELEWRRSMQQMQDLSRNLMRSFSDAQAEAQRRAARTQELRTAEAEERSCFAAIYESKYAAEPPTLFEGTFEEALASARRDKRLLLVWLYGNTSEDDDLCREVFCSETEVFKAFVTEYFVLWPGDAERWLVPVQLREFLRVPALPVLLVLQPLSVYEAAIVPWGDPRSGSPVEFPVDSAWSLLGTWDVRVSGTAEDEMMAFLAEHGDKAVEKERERDRQRQHDLELAQQSRALREQQDREYEESLLADKGRNNPLATESSAYPSRTKVPQQTPEEEAALAAKRAQEMAQEAERQALIEERRLKARQLLEAAPPTGDRCDLVLRLPNGRRAARTFRAEANLTEVYDWATCSGELCGLQGGEIFEVPRNFTLATTYPRAVLRNPEDADRKLRDLGLVPNAVIALCPEEG